MKPPLIKSLKLKEIEIADLQARAATDDKTIDEYAQAYLDGAKFPAAIVFHDGKTYFLADGFHRYFGAKQAGLSDLLCDVRDGTRKDALWFSIGANRTHGLKRSNADKRNAVELALREKPDLTDTVISQHVGVNLHMVTDVRNKLSITNPEVAPAIRTGADGKKYKALPPVVVPNPVESTLDTKETEKPKSSPPVVATAKPVAPVVKPSSPVVIPEPVVKDRTGHPVPKKLVELWERAEEASSLLTTLSTLRGILRKAESDKDKVFAEVSFGTVQAELDRAYTELKTVKPYAVCTACKGLTPENCQLCRGKGFISEFRWNTVPEETKALRAKLIK